MWNTVCGTLYVTLDVTHYVAHWMWHAGCGTLNVAPCMWRTGFATLYVAHWLWHIICGTLDVAHWMWHIICGKLCGTMYVAHYISFVPTKAHTCHKTDSIIVQKGITRKCSCKLHCLQYWNYAISSSLLCDCITRNYIKTAVNRKLFLTSKLISLKLQLCQFCRLPSSWHTEHNVWTFRTFQRSPSPQQHTASVPTTAHRH